ncbi:response regulator/sensor histidine kinase AsgD [Myxococcus xanthus DK 1622]|uniref:histidine kinase n=1 Tax=Myxococcus xanthus (strain DK1622) TaxID=246197 RepID=Q1CWW4_MYXXD|nr:MULTISPECIES: GAF domain-containing protein [Myxococcus]ABF90527.1 response regulator/sensor histidine kinase AsgD [Myxococcus xanthus DK 1622]NOJ56196.1 GAF domain-containing protein [Myxococcus xanthus]QPM79275.1 GAF domain-containing protein [Myxococcus xanthus]QVW68353.1 GAF domain-containing protein [Myxococcus xanthus DZ2]QZZ54599.1 Sensor histidine kinase RcsC [Myxococcus xanthus]
MSQDGIPTMVPLQGGGIPFSRGATVASRVALTSPRISDEAPHRQAKAVSDTPAVLLVDDHVSNLVSLEAILEPLGIRMDKACSGEQALRFLLREDYAVILLDVRMVGLSGFETAALIKQRERTRNVPIIFLTAYGRDDAELVTGYATGAVDFLQKPFPPEVLRSKVSVFVELFRAQQQVRRQSELLRQKEAEARDAALRAAGYIDRLRDFTARLSEAATVPQVCRALFEQGLVAAGAKAGTVNLLDAEGEALEVVDAIGYPESVLSRWRRIPMTAAMPLVESLREQQAIWVGSPEEWSARYPLMDTRGLHEAALALPLLVKGRALGAIGLSFARPRTFTEMDRAFFTALAHACAQALDRVHLTAEERRAHSVARAAAARLQMLTEASDAFDATNRDLSVLLDTITRQVAYFLGDTCTLCLLSDDGTRLEVAASHSNQGEDGAPLLPGEGLSDFVLRGGRPLLVPELSEDQKRELGQGEALRSLLCVPLRTQGRVVGTLSVGRMGPGRSFTQEDQELVEELAAKAALSIENARLFAEQQRSQEELRRRAEFEQQLVGIVSHDLRNPLAAISMSAGLLEKKGALTEPQKRMVWRIGQATERAARMIRDLLDFTKARLGGGIALHRQTTDLREVVHQVVDELLVANPGRRVEVEVQGEVRGEWDSDRIAQVLTNLLGNALAYSPADAPVRVDTRLEGEAALLSVFNGGAPIPRELLPRLFEPLTRGALKEGQSTRSIGLGLYIVQDIVRGHGGGVEVVSSEQHGTTFTVRLPRAAG